MFNPATSFDNWDTKRRRGIYNDHNEMTQTYNGCKFSLTAIVCLFIVFLNIMVFNKPSYENNIQNYAFALFLCLY